MATAGELGLWKLSALPLDPCARVLTAFTEWSDEGASADCGDCKHDYECPEGEGRQPAHTTEQDRDGRRNGEANTQSANGYRACHGGIQETKVVHFNLGDAKDSHCTLHIFRNDSGALNGAG